MPGIREPRDRPGTGHRTGRPVAQTHPRPSPPIASDTSRQFTNPQQQPPRVTNNPTRTPSVRTLRAQTGLLKAQNMIDFIATIRM